MNDTFTFSKTPYTVRFIGKVYERNCIWITPADSDGKPFPKICLDYDPESRKLVNDICPYRKNNLGKSGKTHVSLALIRELGEIRVISMHSDLYVLIKGKAIAAFSSVDYDFTDEKLGCDFVISWDIVNKTERPKIRVVGQTPLTKKEKNLNRPSLDSHINPETKEVAEEIARTMEIAEGSIDEDHVRPMSWSLTKRGINSYIRQLQSVGYEGTDKLKKNLLLYLEKGGDRKRRLYARTDRMINGWYDPADFPEYYYKLWPELLHDGEIVKLAGDSKSLLENYEMVEVSRDEYNLLKS